MIPFVAKMILAENGIKDKSVLYNFARGRTYILSLNYKILMGYIKGIVSLTSPF